jgi:hypothetical protein
MRHVIWIGCLLLGAACDEPLTGPTAPLGSEFTLAPGQAARIEGESLLVRFEGVEGDSRCPADVLCIQGGSATVRISVTARGSTRQYGLQTGDRRPVMHEGFTVALVQLTPFPFSGRPVQPDEYRATLAVTR